MAKKVEKKKLPFKISLGSKRLLVTKSRLEWFILIILVILVIVAQVSGLYPYAYNYVRCHGAPLEVRGSYYRIPYDTIYGIHAGSDYSHCFDGLPTGLQRDPSTTVGAAIVKAGTDAQDRLKRLAAEYEVYVPNGYKISHMYSSDEGSGLETIFTVVTNGNYTFSVREMEKGSTFSYTNLCQKPMGEGWTGTIIGSDDKNRVICRVNPSKYIKGYIVGINIGNTAIMLETPNATVGPLNVEAIAIFSAMELYSAK